MDFLIDTATGDLAFENGDLVEATGLAEIRQRLQSKLELVAGEWFYNRNLGVDYYARVLGKQADPVAMNAVFVQAILSVPGVLKLLKPIDYDLDRTKRILSFSFEVQTIAGVLEGSFTV